MKTVAKAPYKVSKGSCKVLLKVPIRFLQGVYELPIRFL